MKIGSMQRFSLIDYPGKICAIIFTQGCNFRCPYCHNPELVNPKEFGENIAHDEIFSFLERRRGKLDAVSITGGEPTIQNDLVGFIKKNKRPRLSRQDRHERNHARYSRGADGEEIAGFDSHGRKGTSG